MYLKAGSKIFCGKNELKMGLKLYKVSKLYSAVKYLTGNKTALVGKNLKK